MQLIKIAAAAALLAGGATLALAQTTPPATAPGQAPSKVQPGAPTQGPAVTDPNTGTGSRPIGPPADTQPAPGNNPTGVTEEKRKSDQDDPSTGGMKQ